MLPELNEQQQQELIEKVNKIVDLGNQMFPLIVECIDVLKCKEFQLIAMDLESIGAHLNSISLNGPSEPLEEISLEDSETGEDFELTNDQIDEDMWKENADGICQGDLMMSSEAE